MIYQKIFRIFIETIVKNFLHRLSKKYIFEKKYDQLVVYSFDSVSTEINLNGIYEKNFLFFLKNYLKDNMYNTENEIAVDIGAYIGNHSIFLSKIYKKILSFEPHPLSFKILQLNCENFPNINIFNYACSNINKKSFLRQKHTNIGGSFISDGSNPRDVRVTLVQLDNFLKNLNPKEKIGLIKIDVEGHEIETLKGCVDTIKKDKPIITFELKNLKTNKNNSLPETISFLKTLGYQKFYTIDQKFNLNYSSKNLFFLSIGFLIKMFIKDKTEMKEIVVFENIEYQNIIAF